MGGRFNAVQMKSGSQTFFINFEAGIVFYLFSIIGEFEQKCSYNNKNNNNKLLFKFFILIRDIRFKLNQYIITIFYHRKRVSGIQ